MKIPFEDNCFVFFSNSKHVLLDIYFLGQLVRMGSSYLTTLLSGFRALYQIASQDNNNTLRTMYSSGPSSDMTSQRCLSVNAAGNLDHKGNGIGKFKHRPPILCIFNY